ncbi:MAG: hypothetical protein QM756_03220 [Polyangiaceae bacterium]
MAFNPQSGPRGSRRTSNAGSPWLLAALTLLSASAALAQTAPDAGQPGTAPSDTAKPAAETAKPAEAKPAAAPPTPTPASAAAPAAAPSTPAVVEAKPVTLPDELPAPAYIPGYRRDSGLGFSPFSPAVGSLPGGTTPAFAAPSPTRDWTFTWSGYMSATLQAGIHDRRYQAEGQSSTELHVQPRTMEDWSSFTSTNPVQTSWIGMNFLYGSEYVTARVSIDTWNPSAPTTTYQLGSQYFLNNAFLIFRLPTISGFRATVNAGYFSSSYGNLGRYGAGIYVNPLAGTVQGAGEVLNLEYDLSDSLVAILDHGIQGPRVGKPPLDTPPVGANAGANSTWLAAWTHHAHLSLLKKSDKSTLQATLHYMRNWAQDDTSQRKYDIPFTEAIDESYIRDGNITVYGFDARWISSVYGYLAGGVSYIVGHDSYPLKGLLTWGGDGERLTNAWWGVESGGTGKLLLAGVNYSASLGRIITYPEPFPGDHPDLQIDAGFQIGKSWTESEAYDRTRHKYGVSALYTFLPWLGAGLRVDRVVPNSRDSEETYHVIAPRLQFKTDWNSHESITLTYVKWFLGDHSRADNFIPRYLLDDQVVALNFNMYW